ncbi:hypothetical protein DESUT3_04020 [Desulfuromonas versatilis]|uniref:DUF3108 domain-containing protein n=1 Tax=Desulfuromonas versatilis TaxID=2802975 RepID=A0ABM8HRU6_9BACT|nr:DUF3108 domain-containing protein [Desulfuromonas versatilis]BCR03333.1 hypothetical protein DESUT3_04020 [Desulfuromonas versatilis]
MLRLLLALLIVVAALPAAAAEPVVPTPYHATYAVSYRGFNVGLLHFELRSPEAGVLVFETRAEPSLPARLLVSAAAFERSRMHIDGQGVRPLSWVLEDGKKGSEKDGHLAFGWAEQKVSGEVKEKPVALPVEPGLQDRLSIQIAVMTTLLRGEVPGTFPMIDGDEIKHYSYTPAGSASLKTKTGDFATVSYESTRPGSIRVSRVWYAPALGYLPVRAEQKRKGKVETVMELVSVQGRGDR